MIAPTTAEVVEWSRVDFADLDEPFEDTDLDVLVARASDYVIDVTGQTWAAMPTGLESIAQQCVQMRVEQLAFQAQPDYVETGADDLIANFSAGSYSETRRDQKGGSPQGIFPAVNAWPALNSLLWQMMTEDKRDYWLEVLNIANRPAFEVTEVDWAAMGGFSGSDPYVWGA